MSKRKAEIKEALNKKDKRYKLITPTNCKSEVWKNFKVVVFEEKVEDFARCEKCFDLLTYQSRKGTGSLLRHTCSKTLVALPTLSSQILNIPASSAMSERVFSVSSRILEERRTRMLPENLDKTLFLNKNM